jgi:hypothetical protein
MMLPSEQASRVRAALASASLTGHHARTLLDPAGFLTWLVEQGVHATMAVSSGSNDELASTLRVKSSSGRTSAAREPVQRALALS